MTLDQDAAEALVRDYCGWHIAPSQTETLTLDGPGTSLLALPSLHVTAVSAVTNRGETVDADEYDWSASGLVEWRCGTFTRRFRQVTVSLTHGYAEMPKGVAAVIDHLKTLDLSGQVIRVGQVQVATTRSDGTEEVVSAASILDHYRLPSRP